MKTQLLRALLTTAALASASQIHAQDAAPAEATASGNEITEIVVTGARQRSEAVQSAPVAVSVLTPRIIESLNTNNITGLSAVVPNLQVSPVNPVIGSAVVALRGFYNNTSDISQEPAVAVYIDGVYQVLPPGSFADLFDLQSIEVLRGPQGTLLGKNAPAGAVLLNRSRPTGKFGVRAKAEYGSYNLVQGQALVNFPIITDVLSGKIYALYRRRGDYLDNLSFPNHDQGAERRGTLRGALLFEPTSNLSFYLTGEYSYDRSDQKPARNVATGAFAPCNTVGLCNIDAGRYNTTRAEYVNRPKADDYSATLVTDWSGDVVALKSTTGWRDYKQVNRTDLDGAAQTILNAFDNPLSLKNVSEELRINSVDGGGADLDGMLDWVIGGYISHSKAWSAASRNARNVSITSRTQRVVRDSKAIFGQLDIHLTDQWTISGGARRSSDRFKHRFAFPVPATYPDVTTFPVATNREQVTSKNTSFEAGTQYKLMPDKMIYFRYSEGFRPSAFNGEPATLVNPPFPSESSTSYEIGAKTEWLDKRLRFNITLFDIKYKNLQRSFQVPIAGGSFVQVTGPAQARTKGIEIESVLIPVDDLTLRGNFGYLDAKYSNFLLNLGAGGIVDLSGQRLPYAAKYTASVSGDYVIRFGDSLAGFESLTLNASANYRSTTNLSNQNNPLGVQKGYTSVNTAVTLASAEDRYRLQFYVNNLFDKHWLEIVTVIPGVSQWVQDNIERTWGVSLEVKF